MQDFNAKERRYKLSMAIAKKKKQQVTWKCPGVTGSQVSQAITSCPWHL